MAEGDTRETSRSFAVPAVFMMVRSFSTRGWSWGQMQRLDAFCKLLLTSALCTDSARRRRRTGGGPAPQRKFAPSLGQRGPFGDLGVGSRLPPSHPKPCKPMFCAFLARRPGLGLLMPSLPAAPEFPLSVGQTEPSTEPACAMKTGSRVSSWYQNLAPNHVLRHPCSRRGGPPSPVQPTLGHLLLCLPAALGILGAAVVCVTAQGHASKPRPCVWGMRAGGLGSKLH